LCYSDSDRKERDEVLYQKLVDLYLEEATQVRRELHMIPEEGFDLKKTQAYILSYLEDLGYEPETICGTGVILYIKGDNDENAIAFRSDMDALCIVEKAEHEYPSKHYGWMHACGHDGHMAMNLILAKYLADFPGERKRSVLLIFQPAEEGPGGAKPLIEAGIFKKHPVKGIFGYHLFPFIEEGKISTMPGPMMGQNSEFFLAVRGASGHAAEPHRAIDAILASASLITCLQSIVSRNTDPIDSAVISVGLINGGTRINVVAEEVKLSGTMRSFCEETHGMLKRRLTEVVRGVELTHGCTIELKFVDMYPPVVNDQRLYEIYEELTDIEDRKDFQKVMLSEDFSFYQREVPGLFIGLGTGNEKKGFHQNLHTSQFNFDEIVLLKGVETSLKFIQYTKNFN
jgi:hippurate hydrolase